MRGGWVKKKGKEIYFIRLTTKALAKPFEDEI